MQKLLLISLCLFSVDLPDVAPKVLPRNDLAEIEVHQAEKFKKTMAANLGPVIPAWTPPGPRPSELVTRRIEMPYHPRNLSNVRVAEPERMQTVIDEFGSNRHVDSAPKLEELNDSKLVPTNPLLFDLNVTALRLLGSEMNGLALTLAPPRATELLSTPSEVLQSLEGLTSQTKDHDGTAEYRFKRRPTTASPAPEPAAVVPFAFGALLLALRKRSLPKLSLGFPVTPFGEPVSGTGVMRPRTSDLNFAHFGSTIEA